MRTKLTTDEQYMKAALKEAKKASLIGDVPIGCVLVQNDKIIARGYNRRNADKNTLSHAELSVIKKASKKTGDWRLEDCTIYVTIEPCSMCAGTLLWTRIKKIVYGASDLKGGSLGSSFNLFEVKNINHHPEIVGGILREECGKMMSSFFKEKRK